MILYVRWTRHVPHYCIVFGQRCNLDVWGSFYVFYLTMLTSYLHTQPCDSMIDLNKLLDVAVHRFSKMCVWVRLVLVKVVYKKCCELKCEDARLLAFTGARHAMVAARCVHLSTVRRPRCWRFADTATYVYFSNSRYQIVELFCFLYGLVMSPASL